MTTKTDDRTIDAVSDVAGRYNCRVDWLSALDRGLVFHEATMIGLVRRVPANKYKTAFVWQSIRETDDGHIHEERHDSVAQAVLCLLVAEADAGTERHTEDDT